MEAEAGRPANFCDSQPLMPGDIQTFGFLMVLNGGYQIVQVSENVEGIFGLSCESVLGRDFRGFLSAADSNRFMQTLTLADVEVPVMTLQLSFPESDTCFFASIRSIEGNDWLIEFEFLAPDDMDTQLRKRHRVAKAAMALKQCQTVSEMVEKAAADIKAVTCFDKVMIYQFEEGWHGTVVAEAAESDMDFYLGLRFPATDIPEPARKLYELNPVRVIADVAQQPVSLVPRINSGTGLALDLRQCVLRAAAPVHVEYLKNMRVAASTSVSIVKNGVLWGLIALHHRSPKSIPPDMRLALTSYADFFSARLSIHELGSSLVRMSEGLGIQKQVSAAFTSTGSLVGDLSDALQRIAKALGASGIALFFEEKQVHWGAVPGAQKELDQLWRWIASNQEGPVYTTDALSSHYQPGTSIKDVASGLIALSLSDKFKEAIICFRPELVRTVQWAGDPSRTVEFDEDGSTYHPRNSFKVWKEVVDGRSQAWTPAEIKTAYDIRAYVIEVFLNIRSQRLKSLTGLLPICAWCKKIKDEDNSWSGLEEYIEKRSSASITHGMCPSCYNEQSESG